MINYLYIAVDGKDCKELRESGSTTSGIYTINPDGGEPFEVSTSYMS